MVADTTLDDYVVYIPVDLISQYCTFRVAKDAFVRDLHAPILHSPYSRHIPKGETLHLGLGPMTRITVSLGFIYFSSAASYTRQYHKRGF